MEKKPPYRHNLDNETIWMDYSFMIHSMNWDYLIHNVNGMPMWMTQIKKTSDCKSFKVLGSWDFHKMSFSSSFSEIIVKSWWEVWKTSPNHPFLSGFPADCKTELHHPVSTCRDPPFYARGSSFYNPGQLDSNCSGEGTKSGGKESQPSGTRSLINAEIVIGPKRRPISLFSAG